MPSHRCTVLASVARFDVAIRDDVYLGAGLATGDGTLLVGSYVGLSPVETACAVLRERAARGEAARIYTLVGVHGNAWIDVPVGDVRILREHREPQP